MSASPPTPRPPSPEPWLDVLKQTLHVIPVGQWLLIFRTDFDLLQGDEPFNTLSLLYHTPSRRYLGRVLGRTAQSGRLDHPSALLALCHTFFQHRGACLGWRTPDEQFPLSCDFALDCQVLLDESEASERCGACQAQAQKVHGLDWKVEPRPVEVQSVPDLLNLADPGIPPRTRGMKIEPVDYFESDEVDDAESEIESHPTLFECEQCPKSFKKRRTFENHQKTHLTDRGPRPPRSASISHSRSRKSFGCEHCTMTYTNSRSLTKHLALVHQRGFFGCSVCKFQTDSAPDIQTHCSQVHPEISDTVCPSCKESVNMFKEVGGLPAHFAQCSINKYQVQKEKQRKKNLTYRKKPYICSKCGKDCKYNAQLQIHEKQHMGEMDFACSECDFKTFSKTYLRSHLKTHLIKKGVISKPICDICGLEVRDKSALKRHKLYMHDPSTPKACTCPHCGKIICNKNALDRHVMRSHNKSDDFKCTVCSQKVGSDSELRRHMLVHEAPKLKCRFCEKRFRREDGLKNHERNHTGEAPFKCQLCEYSCKSSATLSLHKKFIHNDGKNLTEKPLVMS
ncbi:oocyte zinc finger protein XlCOF6-like isoform X1 [Tigriopus californicus]|uniref:oocyte zinc finger protein XlCOF6-like isoform X1 n=1 Tax=Tigriopus californicus TaxID=6832 RepID=UPI0027DA8485|nr:oocyte zinc finger protein XlCOF6-like isoform X1 [Tigriopus californicus]